LVLTNQNVLFAVPFNLQDVFAESFILDIKSVSILLVLNVHNLANQNVPFVVSQSLLRLQNVLMGCQMLLKLLISSDFIP